MSYTPAITNPGGPPAERATHHGGWTLDKQQAFIDHLAANGRVTCAARAAGMSVQSAYKLRARLPGFAFGWRAATALAYDRLREIALDRADNGALTPNCYRGEVVSVAMRYSDRLILGLLDHLKPEGDINFATGRRDRAIEPAALWAAAVASYDTAHETGRDPIAPTFDGDEPVEAMSREEFLARINALPRAPLAEDDDWTGGDGAAGGYEATGGYGAPGGDIPGGTGGAGQGEYPSRGSPSVSPL